MNIRLRGTTLLLLLRSHTGCSGLLTPSPSSPSPSSCRLHRQHQQHHRRPPPKTFVTTTTTTRFRGGGDNICNTDNHTARCSSSTDTPPTSTSNNDDALTTEEEEEIRRITLSSLSIAYPPNRTLDSSQPPASDFAGMPYLHLSSPAAATAPHRVVFILGGPGAGKGTQSALISKHYPPTVHLSAGELLREARNDPENPLRDTIEDCLVNGRIVPVSVTLGLLREAMDRVVASSVSGEGEGEGHATPIFLIDGFPRNYDNLEGWIAEMPPTTSVVLGAIVYDCPDVKVLEERILERAQSSGRSDDNLTSLRRRFGTFRTETVPVVRVLEGIEAEVSEGADGGGMHVERIRGDGTIEEVWEGTREAMDGFWVHDILTANRELLRCAEGGDVAGYERWFGMDDSGGGGIEDAMRKYEMVDGVQAHQEGKKALRYTNSEGVIEVHGGTEATVSYNRRIETVDGGELVAEFRETRVWSHRNVGWVCIHFARKAL